MQKRHLCKKRREWIEDPYVPTRCPDFEKKRGVWKLPKRICYYCTHRKGVEVSAPKASWLHRLMSWLKGLI